MSAAFLLCWVLAAIGFTATIRVRLRHQRTGPQTLDTPVLLLRPAEFLTEAERRNLASPLPTGVRCLVLSEHDAGPLPLHNEPLRSVPRLHNRKLALLQAALRAHPGEAVVICDADVVVDAALLGGLAHALADGADLAMAAPLPAYERRACAAAAHGLLAHSTHAFAALATIDRHAFCGKAVALSPRAVAHMLLLRDCIGEDLRLAEAVLDAQGCCVCIDTPAHTLPSAGLARFRRWQLVLKAHRPAAFIAGPWFLAPTIPLLTLVPFVAGPLRTPLLAALALLVTLRAVLARRLHRAHAWTWILGEALYLCAFVAALFTRQVAWRGHTLRPGAGGALVRDGS